ncbi:unnamed protein product, partial [Brassica rapa]
FNFVLDWQLILIFEICFGLAATYDKSNLLLMRKLNLYSSAPTCFLGAAFDFPDMDSLSLVFVF